MSIYCKDNKEEKSLTCSYEGTCICEKKSLGSPLLGIRVDKKTKFVKLKNDVFTVYNFGYFQDGRKIEETKSVEKHVLRILNWY